MRVLTRPMDELAHLIQAAFSKHQFYTDRVSADWAKSTIVIEFRGRQPSSDIIRDTLFTLYEKQWGGKPGGLEIAYNRAIEYKGSDQWVYGQGGHSQNLPIRLFITSSPKVLSDLLRNEKVFVLDCQEYKDWRASWAHNALKRAQFAKPRPSAVRDGHALLMPGPMMGREDVDPGEQIPVVRIGLFKV